MISLHDHVKSICEYEYEEKQGLIKMLDILKNIT